MGFLARPARLDGLGSPSYPSIDNLRSTRIQSSRPTAIFIGTSRLYHDRGANATRTREFGEFCMRLVYPFRGVFLPTCMSLLVFVFFVSHGSAGPAKEPQIDVSVDASEAPRR